MQVALLSGGGERTWRGWRVRRPSSQCCDNLSCSEGQFPPPFCPVRAPPHSHPRNWILKRSAGAGCINSPSGKGFVIQSFLWVQREKWSVSCHIGYLKNSSANTDTVTALCLWGFCLLTTLNCRDVISSDRYKLDKVDSSAWYEVSKQLWSNKSYVTVVSLSILNRYLISGLYLVVVANWNLGKWNHRREHLFLFTF